MLRVSILATVCVLLPGGVSVRGQSLPPEVARYADLVLYNGKIVTANDGFEIEQALAIRDGRILAVGVNERILSMAGPDTVRQDLQGRTVVPGFVGTDADNDFAGGNLYKDTLVRGQILGTLPGETLEECLAQIRKLMRDVPPNEPAFFRFEGSSKALDLTREDLDKAAPRNPIMVTWRSFDSIVNTPMLDQLLERLPKSHPHIVKDAKTGEPNGRLYGYAMGVVGWELRPWPRIDDSFLAQQKALNDKLLARGVTTLVGHIQGFSLAVANMLFHRGELHIRMRGAHDFLRQNPFAEGYLRRMGNLVDFGLGDMVKIVGAGLMAIDGASPDGSALTKTPKLSSGGFAFGRYGKNSWIGYALNTDNTKEQLLWEDPDFDRQNTEWSAALAAIKYGWNFTAMHNVGDAATEIWLQVVEKGLQQDLVMKPEFRPFGLDHNQWWDAAQAERVKALDMRRGLGKVFDTPRRAIEMYGDRLHDAQPVPQLIEAGLKVHIEGTEPLLEIQQYVTRRDEEGFIWGPKHAVDRKTALLMKTLWAARFIDEDSQLGSLEPGKHADLVVLGQDFFTQPAAAIARIPVVMTIVGGKIVYRGGM